MIPFKHSLEKFCGFYAFNSFTIKFSFFFSIIHGIIYISKTIEWYTVENTFPSHSYSPIIQFFLQEHKSCKLSLFQSPKGGEGKRSGNLLHCH